MISGVWATGVFWFWFDFRRLGFCYFGFFESNVIRFFPFWIFGLMGSNPATGRLPVPTWMYAGNIVYIRYWEKKKKEF
jgi:hypothetical protein